MNAGLSQDAARAAVDRVCSFYETLSPRSLPDIGSLYAPDARFKDPFNEVRGVPAITRIFEHMFENLHQPRFVVTRRLVDGQEAFLVWQFHLRFRRFSPDTPQVIQGGSHLVLGPDGRVTEHRDYWDAAEELYEKLPAIGALMRWLRRRVNR
ncbi:MAG TPA: nuclear transport factor 2 family protein [Hydrogenophaga sp.]|uniref:nuclear transport factor 2 family protein n=1 Tax=Hydrogenophaga sp. TaxID=1904254 RepID=UPI002BD46BCE|nr:nuclear transport factor 2 family protein [Hydrogenophaga sp.]HMN91975.1 nuclear transport factor 2 family protein [Hydrogenophaga sp.]HMP08777.1 nuclear transport factor 2 family protein [Hydrogenophaga sp.]